MKIYRIKHQFAPFLMELHGLYMAHAECWDYVNVHVFDNQALSNFGAGHRLTSLPRNCDSKLVTAILEKIQCGKATSEAMEILREYLQCAEKKDKNDEIKSDIKASFKKIFFGLLLIAGGVGGLALMVVLIGLFPGVASWISLLIIPVMAAAVCGIINAVIGCMKLGTGTFFFCFRHESVEQLPGLESALHRFCLQSSPPPPTYPEVMENNTTFPIVPELYAEPPTYQQAVKNSTASSSVRTVTPPICIPVSVSCSQYSPHFFHHHPHSAASNSATNANPPAYSHRYQ